jgi:hypothetical protein
MEYLSKSYRLDEEVVAWLDGLKEIHGSVNRGLRAAMKAAHESFPDNLKPRGTQIPRSADLDTHLATEREGQIQQQMREISVGDAIVTTLEPPQTVRRSVNGARSSPAPRPFKGALLKPKERKKGKD